MSAVVLSSDPEAGEQEGGRRLVSSASQILHPDSLEGPKALPSALCQPASLVSRPTCHPVEPFVSRLCVPACYTVPILTYPFIFPGMFFVFMLTWRTPIHTSKARSQIISSRDERKQDPFHPFLNSPSAIRKGRVRSPPRLAGQGENCWKVVTKLTTGLRGRHHCPHVADRFTNSPWVSQLGSDRAGPQTPAMS